MRVIFRTDASLKIGIGHVMRCLTLATELRMRGVDCHFICRQHPGNLISQIKDKGYTVHCLSFDESSHYATSTDRDLAHSDWLGATQDQEIDECESLLKKLSPAWLIVDHYALDEYLEKAVRPYCRQLMVIDDLVDRYHECDVLLDQNAGRSSEDYAGLVPAGCVVHAGPQYALLRREFRELRSYSLGRRSSQNVKNLFVSMGGVDEKNATGQVLEALGVCSLSEEFNITIVMGPNAPWVDQVRASAASMDCPTRILVNVGNMARLMAESDLAFGAAGTSALERCCLGLPTLTAVLADNQQDGARALEAAGAVILFGEGTSFADDLPSKFQLSTGQEMMKRMQDSCQSITDGAGALRLAEELTSAPF